MIKLSDEIGMYEDDNLTHPKLLDVAGVRSRIILTYWNRWEILTKFLEQNASKSFTGNQILDKIHEIEQGNPIKVRE